MSVQPECESYSSCLTPEYGLQYLNIAEVAFKEGAAKNGSWKIFSARPQQPPTACGLRRMYTTESHRQEATSNNFSSLGPGCQCQSRSSIQAYSSLTWGLP